ncbi:MAG: TAXI family TRAP transporter solute-binding subunit [Dehalococcoidia bacterium]|nr:TAXI family TRAP transporter solute-binding subunit [Dehalococcoidia bacterium]
MKKVVLALLMIGLVIGLVAAACASPTPTPVPTATPKAAPTQLSGPSPTPQPTPTTAPTATPTPKPVSAIRLLAAPSGSQTFLGMALWADFIGKKLNIPTSALPGGSVENLAILNRGEAEISYLSTYEAVSALSSSGPFAGKQLRNFRFLVNLSPPMPVIGAVRADSKIQSVADLLGKKVALGTKGSMAETYPLMIMEAGYGLTEEKIIASGGMVSRLSYDAQRDQLSDRSVDVVWHQAAGTVVSAYLKPVEEMGGVRLLGLSDEAAAKIKAKYPFFTFTQVNGGLYKNHPNAVPVGGTLPVVIIRADLPDDLVYKITDALLSEDTVKATKERIINWPTFGSKNEVLLGSSAMSMHPATARWYREHGYTLGPDIKVE